MKSATFEGIYPHFEPELALYKALELRHRAGVRPFLFRSLSFIASERRALRLASRGNNRHQEQNRTHAGGGRRAGSRKGAVNEQEDSRPVKSGNTLVLKIRGFRPGNQVSAEWKSSKYVCAYVSVFSSSSLAQGRLLESYEVLVPVLHGDTANNGQDETVEVAFQFGFDKRRYSESIHLTIHVYACPPNVSYWIFYSAFVRQVVRSEGNVVSDCPKCMQIRNAYRNSTEFRLGIGEKVSSHQAPHFVLSDTTRRKELFITSPDTQVLAFFELRAWSPELATLREGEIGLGALGDSVLHNSNLEVNLEWLRNVSYAASLSACCDKQRPPKALKRPSTCVDIPVGIRSADQVLPATLTWRAPTGTYVKELLRTFRCPICFIWCASWDGLETHFKGYHFRLFWRRPSPRSFTCEARAESSLSQNGTIQTNGQVADFAQKIPKHRPKRMRYFHSGGTFEPTSELISGSSKEEDDILWQGMQDKVGLWDFDEIAMDERAVMLMWNKFIRTRLPNAGAPRRVDRELLHEFVQSNAQHIAKDRLFEQVVWVFITLHKFGLISSDDFLYATAAARSCVS